MNSTERVLAAIAFQKPDRIPRWDSYWTEFTDNWRRHFGLGPEIEPEDYYQIDCVRCVGNEVFFPSEVGVVSEDAASVISKDGWGRTIRQPKGRAYFSETIASVLDRRSDLDRIAFEPAELESRYNGLSENVARHRVKGRCVFAKIGGIYVRSQFMRGEERLLVDMYDDPGFCNALFDKVADHLTRTALETLRRTGSYGEGLFVYDDMANTRAPMFSPAMFGRYLLPRYKKLIETVRKAGCRHVFFHSDGNIMPVMDMLLDAGFEGFHPLEPRCGYDFAALRERCGERAVFFGCACNTMILPEGDMAEIERHVRPLIDLGRDGGLILGSASIGDDISPEIYDRYQEFVRRAGWLDYEA